MVSSRTIAIKFGMSWELMGSAIAASTSILTLVESERETITSRWDTLNNTDGETELRKCPFVNNAGKCTKSYSRNPTNFCANIIKWKNGFASWGHKKNGEASRRIRATPPSLYSQFQTARLFTKPSSTHREEMKQVHLAPDLAPDAVPESGGIHPLLQTENVTPI